MILEPLTADIRFVDTICQPTRDRQDAVVRLLPLIDALVVVGGKNSNNTRELAALCCAATAASPRFRCNRRPTWTRTGFADARSWG